MTAEGATPFALHGAEKMIYDARMQPQAVWRDGICYVVYEANAEGLPGSRNRGRAYLYLQGKWV